MIFNFSRFYYLAIIIIYSVSHLFSQEWKHIFQFSPPQTLNKLEFLNDQVGFTSGSLYNGSFENIHITHDGGKTWSNVNSGYTSMRFMDIYIQNQSTIFISGNEGIILRSIDEGMSWQTMNSGTKEQLWGIHFLDKNLGYAVGSNGTIIRSINGGSDWELVFTGINNLFYDVFFTKQGIGFASGSNVLWKTNDRGVSWFPVSGFPFEAPADWIRNIKMVNETIGFACADIGRIYKTTDGGDHWIRLQSGTQEALFSVDFVDEMNGMVCGFNGTILNTNDGGKNWKQLSNPIGKEIFYSVDMITKDLGYICTHFGHILKMDLSSGVSDENVLPPVSVVYPNPCFDKVHVTLGSITKQDVDKLELCKLSGKCVCIDGTWENDKVLRIDLPQTQTGLFIIKVSTKKHSFALPLYIQSN